MILNTFKLQLVKESGKSYPQYERGEVTSPNKVADLLFDLEIDKEPIESFYLILYDTRLKVIGLTKLSTGTINQSLVDIRSIMQAALLGNAYGIMLAHNHPSGDSRPSASDILATKKVDEAAELLGIHMLDHVVIGHDGEFTSLKAEGHI